MDTTPSISSAGTQAKPTGLSPIPALAVAFGGGLTGFSGILMRFSEVGPVATAGWRLAIAALSFAAIAAFTSREALKLRGWPVLALAGLFFALDISFYHMSLGFTSVAHATLIVNLTPIVALAAGVLFFGERLGSPKLVGMVAAIGGAILMTSMRAGTSGTLAGNTLACLSLIAYALYLVAVKHARGGHGTLSIMLWSSAASTVCLFAGATLMGEHIVPSSAAGWAVVIAMGFVTHVLGQGLIAFGMRETPVGLGSILLLTQPVVSAVVAWPLFGETLGPLEMVGAFLVLAGLVLAGRSQA